MEQQDQVVIDIRFDTKLVDDARTKLAASLGAVNDLKKAQQELNKTIKEQGYATKEQAAQLSRITRDLEAETRAQKSNTAVLQAATLQQYDNNASLDEQRQYLNTLQKAVASMSKEQMDMLGGQEALQAQIKAVTESVKAQEHAIGDDRRNVGNYTESLVAAAEQSHNLADAFKVTAVGQTQLGKATDSLDKAMKLASKNPWMAVLSLLLPLLKALFDALRGNEQAMAEVKKIMDAMREAFKQFEPLIRKVAGVLTKVLGKAFDFVTAAITKVLQGIDWLASKLGYDLHLSAVFDEAAHAAGGAADEVEAANTRIVTSTQKAVDAQAELEKKLEDQREKMRLRRMSELEREIDALQKARDAELATEGLTLKERLEIEDYYLNEIAKKHEEFAQRLQEASAQIGYGDEEEENDVLTPEEQARRMFGLDEAGVQYFVQLLNEGVSFAEAKTQAITDQTMRMTAGFAKSFGALGGAFNEMGNALGEFAEENEDAAKAQKAFSFMGILLNQAQSISNGALAIAEGVASAASIQFPGNIPAIISITAQIGAMIAGVMSTIAQSKQIFAQAEQQQQKFAGGGIVGGTSYSGDHVQVRANSGEMWINSDSQKRLFDSLTGNGDGSLGFNYELLAQTLSSMPAPVVDYTELQQFGQKVATYNEIAAI